MKAVASVINHSGIYHEREGKCHKHTLANKHNHFCSELQIKRKKKNPCLIDFLRPVCVS